jgi:hypothetical protein
MNLYEWNSPTFADWADGTIIAIGKDVEEARNRVKETYKDNIFLADIIKEITVEPYLNKSGAFHIMGSG